MIKRQHHRFVNYALPHGRATAPFIAGERFSAKFWLDPDASLVANHGYSRKELREVESIVRENLELLRNEWDEFCRGYIS